MKERSQKKELMDGPLDDPLELHRNLEELVFINRFTANYPKTLRSLKKMIPDGQRELTVLDLGCGAGDWLWYVYKNLAPELDSLHLIGLDIEPHAIEFARKNYPGLEGKVQWECCSYRDFLAGEPRVDIATANLFCHHLTEEEISELLALLEEKCIRGFLINDLERNPIAFYSIAILTRLFSRSRYTRNDAPLSVKRGFKKPEWKKLLKDALNPGSMDWQIDSMWAFRHLICARKNQG
ncbi:MAG: methyltransferase domain-containing protein [Saprospirales bacterium]|nr:MAG: methyltransferase domain-containing protein [Saprospirales bacterium]